LNDVQKRTKNGQNWQQFLVTVASAIPLSLDKNLQKGFFKTLIIVDYFLKKAWLG